MKTNFQKPGFSLVEAILAGFLFSALATILITVLLYAQENPLLSGQRARAVYLAEEGIEAARAIQENNFANLGIGTFGLATSSNQWTLSGSSDTQDGFTRSIAVSALSASRKAVAVTVNWVQNAQRSGTVSLNTVLTNWRAPTLGDWTNPNTLGASLDLAGNNDAWRLVVSGSYAYVIEAANPSNFLIIDISNPALPVLQSTTNVPGNPRDIKVVGNYAYIASTDNTREINIYDISNPLTPLLAGSYNAIGNADAYSIDVVGNYLYFGRIASTDPEFYVLDIYNLASISLLGSLQLTSAINEVAVSGNYAYLATANTAQELQIINVTTSTAPVLAGFYNVTGSATANDVLVFGNNVALALSNNQVAILNVSSVSSPTLVSSAPISSPASGISLGNNNTYLFVSSALSTAELQIFDISTIGSPTLLGIFNASASANDVYYDPTTDRAYLADTSNTQELIIVAP